MLRRRELVVASLAGAGLGSGCLPLLGLMRLGMRGAAIRGGARAARAGPRGNLYALGRTGAAALHTVRLLRLAQVAGRLARIGDIFGVENGEEAVCVDADGQRVECTVEGVVVCSTHLQGRFFEHVSALYGPCGTSRAVAESEIHHWDTRGVFAGADIMEDHVIRHIGSKQEVLGYTRLQVTQRGSGETVAVVDRDGFLNKQMVEMEKSHREVLGPTGARDLQAIASAQAQCMARHPTESCSDLQTRAQDALSRLEARFRQFT